jgi:hypothetical protein
LCKLTKRSILSPEDEGEPPKPRDSLPAVRRIKGFFVAWDSINPPHVEAIRRFRKLLITEGGNPRVCCWQGSVASGVFSSRKKPKKTAQRADQGRLRALQINLDAKRHRPPPRLFERTELPGSVESRFDGCWLDDERTGKVDGGFTDFLRPVLQIHPP